MCESLALLSRSRACVPKMLVTGMLCVVCNYSVDHPQLACVWLELDSAHLVIQAGMTESMNEWCWVLNQMGSDSTG